MVCKSGLRSYEVTEELGEKKFAMAMKQLYNYDKRLYIIVRTRFYNESK